MAGRIIKIAGLVVLAAALSAPLASAKELVGDGGGSAQIAAAAPTDRAGTQGIGQTPAGAVTAPLVIPYLSHGVGVDAAQFGAGPARPDDRAGARPSVPTDVAGSFAAPVSTTGDGFDWGSAGIGAAGLAALVMAIGLLVALGRRSRGHEDVAVS